MCYDVRSTRCNLCVEWEVECEVVKVITHVGRIGGIATIAAVAHDELAQENRRSRWVVQLEVFVVSTAFSVL